MSVVMNSCIFYGYEVSERAAQLIEEAHYQKTGKNK